MLRKCMIIRLLDYDPVMDKISNYLNDYDCYNFTRSIGRRVGCVLSRRRLRNMVEMYYDLRRCVIKCLRIERGYRKKNYLRVRFEKVGLKSMYYIWMDRSIKERFGLEYVIFRGINLEPVYIHYMYNMDDLLYIVGRIVRKGYNMKMGRRDIIKLDRFYSYNEIIEKIFLVRRRGYAIDVRNMYEKEYIGFIYNESPEFSLRKRVGSIDSWELNSIDRRKLFCNLS